MISCCEYFLISVNQSVNGVNHSEGYDPAHPLAEMIDTWNLRLPNSTLGEIEIVNNNVQAMLTGQMDQYYMSPVGESVDSLGNHIYMTEEAVANNLAYEQALYQWFCNWLNGMDFKNMSEMERAQEIKNVLAQATYDETNNEGYYGILISKKGKCAEYAMTACALAKAMGLKSAVSGYGSHAVYYIQIDGEPYFGQNETLSLHMPTTAKVFFQ